MKYFKVTTMNITTLLILLSAQVSFIYLNNMGASVINFFCILLVFKLAYYERIIELSEIEINRKAKIINWYSMITGRHYEKKNNVWQQN